MRRSRTSRCSNPFLPERASSTGEVAGNDGGSWEDIGVEMNVAYPGVCFGQCGASIAFASKGFIEASAVSGEIDLLDTGRIRSLF